MILAWTGDELSHGQAQNEVNFDFEVKFDLEGQGQSPPKTIGILTKVFYTFGPNLVILARADDELSRGQASAYRTHRRTDGQTHRQTDSGNDNTRRPKLASGNDYHMFKHKHKSWQKRGLLFKSNLTLLSTLNPVVLLANIMYRKAGYSLTLQPQIIDDN